MRKVKQNKEKEDENSLFDEIKIKSQAAMEYLMTYGWAILIIALALGVLYSLGVLSPETFKPQICSLSPPFYCSDQYLSTTGVLTLTIAQGSGSTITINKIACVDKSLLLSNGLPSSPSYWSSVGVSIPSGFQRQIGNIICYSSSGQPYIGKIGSVFSGAIIINATTSTGANIFSLGEIGAPVKTFKSSLVTSGSAPSGILYYVPITISNSQSSATPNPFQQIIQVDVSKYSTYMVYNGSFANFEFFYENGTIIPAWIESYSAPILTIWVKIKSIPASSSLTIYLGFASKTTNLLSSSGTSGIGEAPQLSPTYAQYDNGASVFNFYDNFAGTTLSSKWTSATSSTTITVNNQIIIVSSGSTTWGGIITASSFSTSTIFDAYLNSFTVQSSTYNSAHGISAQSGGSASSAGYTYTSWTGSNSNGGTIARGSMSGGITSLLAGPNFPTSNAILSAYWVATGNEGFGVNYNFVSTADTSVSNAGSNYYSFGAYYNAQSATSVWYWARVRAYPPNGVMPSVSFGSVQ